MAKTYKSKVKQEKPPTEEERKEEINEAGEVLDAIGQRNEKKGIKWTQHFMDEWDREKWHENQLKKEKLEEKRKYSRMNYHQALSGMLQDEAQDLDVPFGYRVWSEFSGEGVILKVSDVHKNTYYDAFRPDGTPEIDFNVAVQLLIAAQDTIDMLERERVKSLKDRGIILPK